MNGTPEVVRVAEFQITLDSEAETDALGRRLADASEPGLVIGLVGGLGAGKTRLVRATAIALGADPQLINSPTFVLIQSYAASVPIYHFDTYRLRDADEFADLGPEEYFQPDTICFVEWSDRVLESLPEDLLRIELAVLAPTRRSAILTADGPRAERVLARIMQEEDHETPSIP